MSGLRKIGDIPTETGCTNRFHDPPNTINLQDGLYEYVCPECGRKVIFTIDRSPKIAHTKNSKTLE